MSRAVPAAFGLLMVLAAGADGGPVTLAVLALGLAAVAGGLFDLRAAAAAVVLAGIALAVSDPAPLFAAVAGLAAAAYLLTRHAEGAGAVTLTVPSVVGMLGFTLAGLAATAIATDLTWVPLLAPAVLTGVLIMVVIPLLADDRTGVISGPDADTDQAG